MLSSILLFLSVDVAVAENNNIAAISATVDAAVPAAVTAVVAAATAADCCCCCSMLLPFLPLRMLLLHLVYSVRTLRATRRKFCPNAACDKAPKRCNAGPVVWASDAFFEPARTTKPCLGLRCLF